MPDTIYAEIMEMINLAVADGYDVKIIAEARRDGRDGTITLPMDWINRLADRKENNKSK